MIEVSLKITLAHPCCKITRWAVLLEICLLPTHNTCNLSGPWKLLCKPEFYSSVHYRPMNSGILILDFSSFCDLSLCLPLSHRENMTDFSPYNYKSVFEWLHYWGDIKEYLLTRKNRKTSFTNFSIAIPVLFPPFHKREKDRDASAQISSPESTPNCWKWVSGRSLSCFSPLKLLLLFNNS